MTSFDVNFHFHELDGVSFSRNKNFRNTCKTSVLQSKILERFLLTFLFNGGNLETSEGYTCLFVVSCVLVIRNTVLFTK